MIDRADIQPGSGGTLLNSNNKHATDKPQMFIFNQTHGRERAGKLSDFMPLLKRLLRGDKTY
ncbi:hypothetical protein SAMN02746065_1507 [Desulfocicer vacuolatum DSM 3385]|uniref:Uncharacterized protein n=1 Tax=Desulfocicer vacuolatum DSM 3385 TaxID=1121400 RepID=A0A1W2EWK7_9BACT|nr:hypothetical protein [Desulfocicer vacuolatum]SMD13598.1 hypothetical protein SAMN02746065_1507 [Desulfocicer vacuolatum DSM 3385]